jgi:hypothetical protein
MNTTVINIKQNIDFLTTLSFHLPETILCILVFCICCKCCCCYVEDCKRIICKKRSNIPYTRTFSSFEILEAQVVLSEINKNNPRTNSSIVVIAETDENNIPIANEIYITSADEVSV